MIEVEIILAGSCERRKEKEGASSKQWLRKLLPGIEHVLMQGAFQRKKGQFSHLSPASTENQFFTCVEKQPKYAMIHLLLAAFCESIAVR